MNERSLKKRTSHPSRHTETRDTLQNQSLEEKQKLKAKTIHSTHKFLAGKQVKGKIVSSGSGSDGAIFVVL